MCIHGNNYSAMKKNETNISSNVEGPRDYCTKSKKDILYDISYMWNLRETLQMNLQIRNGLTDLENKLTQCVGRDEGKG